MSAQRHFSCLIVIVGLFAPGCAIEAADDQLAEGLIGVPLDPMGGPSDPTDLPPGSENGYLPVCEWEAHVIPAYRKYAGLPLWNAPMSATRGTLPGNPNMNLVPASCREKALKYLIRCALPRDTSAIDPVTGDEYWGWLGIAPDWRTTPLTGDDQWWVTGCVMQHLNGFGVEVPILLDGAHSALYPAGEAHSGYPKNDSRIWGNMFSKGNFVINVCYETDLINQCNVPLVVDTRLCDSDPTLNCNMNIVGPCSTACTYSLADRAYSCGTGGIKNVGSRLKDFSMYGSECVP